MTEQAVTLPSGSSVPIDVIGRASPEIFTTTTADPGSGGTSLAVTLRDRFPQSGSFLVRVEAEEMLVTAGQGTSSGSFTVTRAQNGTTAVAHAIGVAVAQVVGVQRVEPVYAKKQITFKGHCGSFAIPGRAGTSGQKVFAIFNAAGSGVIVDVEKVQSDIMVTAAKLVQPAIVRLYNITAVPTNGSAVTKVADDSTLTTSSSVTLWQDASADGTGSGTALTATPGSVIEQTWSSRALTLVGYEQFDQMVFLDGDENFVTLNAGQGVLVMLDYTVATANPTTDRWVCGCRWVEYTNA